MTVYIRVKKTNGRIYTMDIEDYVKGVVPRETPASWHPEALKAQAIAARTYALANRKHRAAGYDVCSTTHCQVYSDLRDVRTNAAVEATRGIVGVAHGTRELRSTYFSARCGGHTSNSWGPSWLRYIECICYPPRFGHGQGYCQTGGHRYGLRGWKAKAILDHYYILDWRLEYGQGAIWDGKDVTAQVPPQPPPPPTQPPLPPQEPPETPAGDRLDEADLLDDAINFLWNIHTALWQKADHVHGVPIIGEYLESFLDSASQTLRTICFRLWNFRTTVLRAYSYINQVLDGTLIDRVLEAMLWNFALLRRDPGAWVKAHIDYMFPQWSQFIADPQKFILDAAQDMFAEIRQLMEEPATFLQNTLQQHFPVLQQFNDNPDDWIIGTLQHSYTFWNEFVTNPVEFIKKYAVFDIKSWIDAERDFIYKKTEELLEYFWEH